MLKKKVILFGDSFVVSMCGYAPGEHHGVHADAHSRISFLVRGGFREEGKAGVICMAPGQVLLKSRHARHEDQFGETGAQIAAIEFTGDDPFDAVRTSDLWRQRGDGFALRHATTFLEAALAGDRNAAVVAGVDLVANTTESQGGDGAPAWLTQLRNELEEVPLARVDVAARARSAGAHPAHASRLFRRCFGASITEHAHAQSVRRAFGPLASQAGLGEVALAAGFYDQSHMTRVFRRVIGRTPGAHRAMLASALR